MFELRSYRKNQMSTWNPFAEMEEMEREMFGGGFFNKSNPGMFKTDITDEGDHFELKADLPGFRKEDIHLELSGDTLTISAERHSEHEKKEQRGKYVCVERSYGSYSRRFDLSAVDADNIKAKYDNGVLTLNLPKKASVLPASRQLEIE